MISVVKENKPGSLSPGAKTQPEHLIGHEKSCDQSSSPDVGAGRVEAFSASVVMLIGYEGKQYV